ncbi:FecR domain-containing protein [Candidatus Kuenenbacteria bacterium]|nr:FecR domain-containing protein [Candidatus Kuenenbacteria bacterium]
MSKIFKFLLLFILVFSSNTNFGEAKVEEFKKGVAHGTFMMQGYSGLEAPGTLRFFAAGAQAAESSLSYVDDAYISLDDGDREGNPYELKGTFSGGPNGVATFVNYEGLSFSVPLKNGRTFDLSIPGVQVHMTVSDPSIFEIDEEDLPAEYDPDAPLTDSGVRPADISGQVEIACPPDFEAWDVLKMGRVIYNHCKLKTGEDSTLKISLQSGTSFTMKPETELVINETIKEKSKIKLLFGNIWANVKKMVKGEEIYFEGSQAVAGIKGTTFEMIETGETTTLKVIEGTVEFRDKADGKTEMVNTGESLAVDLRGFGEKTKFDPSTETENKPIAPTENKIEENKSESKSDVALPAIITLAIVIGAVWVVKKRKK